MDVDISDILADVSRPLRNTSQFQATSQPQHLQFTDPEGAYFDHQLLVRAWTSERCAPDLLPYPTTLMDRIMERVRDQITRIEDLTAGISDGQYGNSHSRSTTSSTGNQNINLILSVLQTDLSRTQFIVRSLLRQRLAKISKYAMHYMTQLDADTKSNLLSTAEIQYLKTNQALLTGFYEASFLSAFPQQLRRLDDSSGGVSMVEGPDLDTAILVRCVAEIWGNGAEVDQNRGREGLIGAMVELRMRRGEIWVVRWRDVRSGVIQGDVELL